MTFDVRRLAIAINGFCAFLNLYSPQALLPELSREFGVTAAEIAPVGDLEWITASADDKRRFWKAAVEWVLKAKDQELAAGLDRFGDVLWPIAESTRPKGRVYPIRIWLVSRG